MNKAEYDVKNNAGREEWTTALEISIILQIIRKLPRIQ